MSLINIDKTQFSGTTCSTQRKIVKTSSGVLVLFCNLADGDVDQRVRYTVSDDNGATWGAWNLCFNTYDVKDFDCIIDDLDNILVAISTSDTEKKVYFVKLTNVTSTTWNTGSPVLVKTNTSAVSYAKILLLSTGDIWIFFRSSTTSILRAISTDGGGSWGGSSLVKSGSMFYPIEIGTGDIWLFVVYSAKLTLYIYTGTWDSGTDIHTDASVSMLSVGKISDSSIYVAIADATGDVGIKVFYYNGSWDGGTLLSDNGNDGSNQSLAIEIINSLPCVIWADYNGSQYDMVYRYYSGASWDAAINLTNDATQENYLTSCISDSNKLYVAWTKSDGGAGYDLWFAVDTLFGDETVTINETITLTDSIVESTIPELIEINETITLTDSIDLLPTLEWEIIDETITLTETDIIGIPTDRILKIVRNGNYLYLLVNSTPVQILKLDLTLTPPIGFQYCLSGSYTSPKDLAINTTFDLLYVTFSSGKILKFSLSDLSSATLIDTSDSNDLYYIDCYNERKCSYVSTDDITGEIIKIDEQDLKYISSDLRFLIDKQSYVSGIINLLNYDYISSDLRFLIDKQSYINSHLCFTLTDTPTPIARTDFKVWIDGVEQTTLLVLDTIDININADDYSTCSFRMAKKHDSYFPNQLSLQIYIGTILIFDGKVSEISGTLTKEELIIYGKSTSKSTPQTNLVLLPLASTNENYGMYHIITENISISNPDIDELDEYEIHYKGVQADLGYMEIEDIENRPFSIDGFYKTRDEYSELSDDLATAITEGTFVPTPGYTYFWFASGLKFSVSNNSIVGYKTFVDEYIGTSPSILSGSIIKPTSANYSVQKIKSNKFVYLGTYSVGSAPYKVISVRNGAYRADRKYEDREDGLYVTYSAMNDYTTYVKKMVDMEYEKLKTINDSLDYLLNASFNITLDAYFFYGIGSQTRINVSNTTLSNIFKDQYGFPVAVKKININSGSMQVTLRCDNSKSISEIEALSTIYGEEDLTNYEISARELKLFDKYIPALDV